MHDEVTYALWAREHPQTRVLARVDADFDIDKGWEDRMDKVRTVVPAAANDPLGRRAYVLGIVVNGKAKAYPHIQLAPNSLRGPKKPAMTYAVMDRVGGVPVAVLVGGDGISVRVFDRRVGGKEIELMTKFGSSPARFLDTTTGSEWDIAGVAVSGPMAGRTARTHPLHDGVLVRLAAAPPGHGRPYGMAAAALHVTPALVAELTDMLHRRQSAALLAIALLRRRVRRCARRPRRRKPSSRPTVETGAGFAPASRRTLAAEGHAGAGRPHAVEQAARRGLLPDRARA